MHCCGGRGGAVFQDLLVCFMEEWSMATLFPFQHPLVTLQRQLQPTSRRLAPKAVGSPPTAVG